LCFLVVVVNHLGVKSTSQLLHFDYRFFLNAAD